MPNKNIMLTKARINKKNEFFTLYEDVQEEVLRYRNQFHGKTVFCNCNDSPESSFYKFFTNRFKSLGLKKLICTKYNFQGKGKVYTKTSSEEQTADLNGDGGFSSEECLNLLTQSDIVVTNPPFSEFVSLINLLLDYEKRFLLVGHQSAIGNRRVFPFLKENRVRLGYGFKRHVGYFINRYYDDYASSAGHKEGMIRVPGITWFTNLDLPIPLQGGPLTSVYEAEKYPKYLNYDAIEVSRVKDIPRDYTEAMGVPITFMYKYDPEQFEILGISFDLYRPFNYKGIEYSGCFYLPGKDGPKGVYTRVIIRRRNTV